jgi:hypothetical protein
MVSIGLILLAVVIIVIMAVSILGKENKVNNEANTVSQNTTNYVSTSEGNKVNTSKEVVADKKVENLLIEKSQIVFQNGTSKLTSKVINDAIAKENLRFKVKFVANDGSIIAESVEYIGKIGENETKYIDSYITADVSNAKDITYEIME